MFLTGSLKVTHKNPMFSQHKNQNPRQSAPGPDPRQYVATGQISGGLTSAVF